MVYSFNSTIIYIQIGLKWVLFEISTINVTRLLRVTRTIIVVCFKDTLSLVQIIRDVLITGVLFLLIAVNE